jgi:hypothetical protein
MMLQPLGTRTGWTRYAISSLADLDLPALQALMAEAG